MILSRMINFIKLSVCVFVLWKTVGCQNANLTVIHAKAYPGDSITLTCKYMGTGKVSAVSWFNGSNSDVLILTPGSSVPDCDVFLTINTSYDPRRISYTCDVVRNMYTLRINPLGTVDNGVKWSCTCQDPQPDAKRAEYTIHLTATTQLTMGNEVNATETLPLALIIGVSVGGVVVIIIIIICYSLCKCWKQDLYKTFCCCYPPCCFYCLHREVKKQTIHKYNIRNHIKAEDVTAYQACELLCEKGEFSQQNASQKLNELCLDERT